MTFGRLGVESLLHKGLPISLASENLARIGERKSRPLVAVCRIAARSGGKKRLTLAPQLRSQAAGDAARAERNRLVSRERDRRFAVPRCWSRGDSNRRSSLWFLAVAKGSKFQRGHYAEPGSENCSPNGSAGKFRPKTAGLRPLFQRGKRPKRTGGSNPLCSSNESLRTAGPVLSIQPGRRRFLVEFRFTWHAAVARDGSIDHGRGQRDHDESGPCLTTSWR